MNKKADAQLTSEEIENCLKEAKAKTIDRATGKDIDLMRIDLVTPVLHESKQFGVWFFYPSELEVTSYAANGTTQRLKNMFTDFLMEMKFPNDYLTGMQFYVDSDENLQRFREIEPVTWA